MTDMSAITWTMIVSLVAATRPLHARAARKLLCEVANACQIFVRITRNPNTIEVGRLPKMFDRGTIRMLAKPSVITLMPVRSDSCCELRWNCAPSSGNIGAMLSAEQTSTLQNNLALLARVAVGVHPMAPARHIVAAR